MIALLYGGDIRDRLLSLPLRGELEAIVELVALPPTPRACPFFRRCGDNKVVNEEAIEPNMRDGDKRRPGDNVTDDGVLILSKEC